MEKRYQVFVSSTFADLKEEREEIMRALMKMDCIPAGMELFPAADEEQMQFIKKIIDDSDYYLLLIGGRYGSVSESGVSYTEQEYEYAKSKGIKVIALLHKDPESLPVSKSEKNPDGVERLKKFRQNVSTGRLVQFWERTDQLPGLVALSLMQTIKTYPAVGWVRGNTVASEDLLRQINDLRQENDKLRLNTESSAPSAPKITGLAGLDETFELTGYHLNRGSSSSTSWQLSIRWSDIFWHLFPYIEYLKETSKIKVAFDSSIRNKKFQYSSRFGTHDTNFQSVLIQARALGFVVAQGEPGNLALTPQGTQMMYQLRAARGEEPH